MTYLNKHIIDGVKFNYHETLSEANDPIHYPHTHDFCELYFHISGDCTYMVDNGLFKVPPGLVIFTRPGEMHCVHIDTACKYERAYYQIDVDSFDFLGGNEVMRCFFDRPFGERNSLLLPADLFTLCLEKTAPLGKFRAGRSA